MRAYSTGSRQGIQMEMGEPRLPREARLASTWVSGSLATLDVQRNALYDVEVIQSFRSKETEELFEYHHSRRFSSFERVALRKLLQLHAATELHILASPPGNQLEALRGDRKGQHSIRINNQWRICFVWRDGHAYEVEIADYH